MKWPICWGPINESGMASALLAQLQKELSAGHPLYGLSLRAIGRHQSTDDVLFVVNDSSGRVAEVHLTWKNRPERPPWPCSSLYGSFGEWAQDVSNESDLP